MKVALQRVAISVVFSVASSLSWAASVPAAPEDGGPRNFQVTGVTTSLNMRAGPSVSAGVVGHLKPGAILSNLGCQAAGGRAWCYVQPFEGGPVGYVDASYLTGAVGPNGAVATGPDDSALRAGKGEFDATGKVPCAMKPDQPMTRCDMGVARAGEGYATVVITRLDGRKRIVFFTLGRAMGTDSAEADPSSFRFAATKVGDLTTVHIGDERYEIPDVVVLGD